MTNKLETRQIPDSEAEKGVRRTRKVTPIAPGARRPTVTERFLAMNFNAEEEEVETTSSSDGAVTTKHTGAKLVLLYKATTWGWESVLVPSTNLNMLLGNGFRVDCGDCNGNCSPDPGSAAYNGCPGRPKFATMSCGICGKVAYDFGARVVHPDLLPQRPNPNLEAIKEMNEGTDVGEGVYTQATPRARLKAVMDNHIMAFHESDAASLGLMAPDPRLRNPARSEAEARMALNA